ncbi:MAG: purine nucleoside permease [Rhizorhabdus sp.]
MAKSESFLFFTIAAALIGLGAPAAGARTSPAPVEIATVVVTAFEVGDDMGDTPGELQNWAATIPDTLPFAASDRALRYDAKRKLLVLNTGIGTNRAATSVMALGTDPRFDLTHAYWIVAAIAGVNPYTASVGSAAWIGDVVDTDYGYAIDPRETPAGWEAGIYPRDRSKPYEGPRGETIYNLFPLNKSLRDWAFALTANVALPDGPVLQKLRAGYPDYPVALCPPKVLTGDEATGQTFWHGKLYNTHTVKWVEYWTGRKDSFVMTAMEDSGVQYALSVLGKLGKADADRLLVLRTGSNYAIQPKGKDAAQSLEAEAMELSALKPSVDAAFLVATPVVNAIAKDWPRYRAAIPAGPAVEPAKPVGCAP